MAPVEKNKGKGFSPGRRTALTDIAKYAVGATIAGGILSSLAGQSKALPATTLRPPGALLEDDFTSACVRCGLCVRDCPYDTLKLSRMGDGPAIGTPYFIAREVPCEMCEDIPCVKACPTGALEKSLTDITTAKMGIAVLIGRETCLSMLGLRCEACYRICPLMGEAITLEQRHNPRTGRHAIFEPVVHAEVCTGCGKCERSCVLEEAAIKVLPVEIAQGQQDTHYRRGWEEKEKAGEELVPGIIDLPDRLPGAAK